MNVQLDNVLRDIMGVTGQLILRAIVAGERDAAALARFRHRNVKADQATIARSLRGTWRDMGEVRGRLRDRYAAH